ncbi:MAG TPA: hypothetical protein VGE63_03215 [Candidatus Paceibacterota bacterium]
MKNILVYGQRNSFIENDLNTGWTIYGNVSVFAAYKGMHLSEEGGFGENEVQIEFSQKMSSHLSLSLLIMLQEYSHLFDKVYVYLDGVRYTTLIDELQFRNIPADKVIFFIMPDKQSTLKKEQYLEERGYGKSEIIDCDSCAVEEIGILINNFKKEV